MEDKEKEITTVWTKSNALVWVLMLVTMHVLLWSGFASYILENEVKPMFLAMFVVGLGIGVMVTDTFHDWLRQKALKRERNKDIAKKPPYVKLNAGKTAEVLASRIKVGRHDALYLNCPWCDHKITDTEMFVTGTGECKQCGLTIDIKENAPG